MEDKRKRLSGHQYRLKKLKTEAATKQMSNTMKCFLKEMPSTSSENTALVDEEQVEVSQLEDANCDNSASASANLGENISKQPEKVVTDIFKESVDEDAQSANGSNVSTATQPEATLLPSSDPAMWNITSMTDRMRQILVENGPQQIQDVFLKTRRIVIFPIIITNEF